MRPLSETVVFEAIDELSSKNKGQTMSFYKTDLRRYIKEKKEDCVTLSSLEKAVSRAYFEREGMEVPVFSSTKKNKGILLSCLVTDWKEFYNNYKRSEVL